MATRYTPITDLDLQAWIGAAKVAPEDLKLPGVFERVLYWPVKGKDFGVIVWTSIVPGWGSREAGEDAIRVCVGTRAGRVLSGTRRIHRTQGWRKRLTERVRESYLRARGWPTCSCGATMVERTQKTSGKAFLGCSTFPKCRQTRPNQ